jgi:predicted CopG family antitoxin
MVKTITIKEEIFNRLTLQKAKDESFSDLFERLLDNQVSGSLALKKLRGSIEIDENIK